MQKQKKKVIVIFEGPDKTGKTTLLREFNKQTNYKYISFDRLTTSSKIFGKFFKRNTKEDLEYYKEVENELEKVFTVVYIFCTASLFDIRYRLTKVKEELPKELQDIEAVKQAFLEEYLEKADSSKNVLLINTSANTPEHLVNVIKRYVELVERTEPQ